MIGNRTLGLQTIFCISIISLLIVLSIIPVLADDSMGSVIGRYDGWSVDNSPTVGMGIFPAVTLEPTEDTSLTISPASGTSSSPSTILVTVSPFISMLNGQETHIIVGYISGARSGATVKIAGKNASDSDFSDITTIKPDENGLFVWPVPSSKTDLDLFRVTAVSGNNQVLSNAIRFTPQVKDPVIKPVVNPVQTTIPMVTSSGSSVSELTQLSLSASTTSPKVGDEVVISGRLTDQNGKGISGATVTIDETGYPGASTGEPFVTTQTGSDGRFESSLSVKYANIVGLVANYEGDSKHHSAESNTLTFSSHAE